MPASTWEASWKYISPLLDKYPGVTMTGMCGPV